MMYTRDFSPDAHNDIPSGYAGNAFPPTQDAPQDNDLPPADAIPAGATPHHRPPPPHRHDTGLLSRLSLSRLGDLNLGSLLSGDLLLIAVALLLVMGGDDDCEDSGDLWLLLLLLYFMK